MIAERSWFRFGSSASVSSRLSQTDWHLVGMVRACIRHCVRGLQAPELDAPGVMRTLTERDKASIVRDEGPTLDEACMVDSLRVPLSPSHRSGQTAVHGDPVAEAVGVFSRRI